MGLCHCTIACNINCRGNWCQNNFCFLNLCSKYSSYAYAYCSQAFLNSCSLNTCSNWCSMCSMLSFLFPFLSKMGSFSWEDSHDIHCGMRHVFGLSFLLIPLIIHWLGWDYWIFSVRISCRDKLWYPIGWTPNWWLVSSFLCLWHYWNFMDTILSCNSLFFSRRASNNLKRRTSSHSKKRWPLSLPLISSLPRWRLRVSPETWFRGFRRRGIWRKEAITIIKSQSSHWLLGDPRKTSRR